MPLACVFVLTRALQRRPLFSSVSLQRPSGFSGLLESPARSKGSPLGFDRPRESNDRQPGGGRASRKVSCPFSVDPAASRCPVQPASGPSRFGVAALRRIVRFPPAARPCGFSLSAGSDPRPPSFAIAHLDGSFLRQRRLRQVMHRRLTLSLSGDVPLPAPQAMRGLAGNFVPAALLGFGPSQHRSCSRHSRCRHLDIPTCRFVKKPPRSFFIEGPAGGRSFTTLRFPWRRIVSFERSIENRSPR